jgi:hypothetical protein
MEYAFDVVESTDGVGWGAVTDELDAEPTTTAAEPSVELDVAKAGFALAASGAIAVGGGGGP